ncbi:MAG: Unknown protein [uncultured Sulfurovum sp.]|uniref:Uncharacterized protein n=1 Tax=uncultured Sulfurovum sp. TaxID=269237 RepID=A0A6S6RX23_9BACT|nr:MAG: Unknown protein [uncultured Sulfurovum sp.]
MKKDSLAIKLPNGEAVREFYLSLSIIQEYYWEKGYRKKAYLYRTLKEKLGWKMSLESFKYHFRKAFNEPSTTKQLSNVKSLDNEPKEDLTLQVKAEPKVATIEVTSPISKIKKNTRAVRESL